MTTRASLALLFVMTATFIRQTEPWTPAQLLEPSELAAKISHPAVNPPLIICVGPSGLIKGSIETGPAKDSQNLDSLKRLLQKQDPGKEVIIYCGCCPFEHCPNVRPAFTLLNEMHFTRARLLNLSHNIKVDWIDHKYPVKEGN
ncbi:MAG: rhodanese-like domain-containing protein [Bacteroidetes bacterium]|nr:rhodanese-like domain-containing protein [Bacteroidota bacterium]